MPSCSICVEDLKKPSCCIPCGHVFCSDCIKDWKQQKKARKEWNCPQCRKTIIDTQVLYIDQEDDVLKYKDKCDLLQEKIDKIAERLEVIQSTNQQLNAEINTRYKTENKKLQDRMNVMTGIISNLQATNRRIEVRLTCEIDSKSKLSLEVSNLKHDVLKLKDTEALVDDDEKKLSSGNGRHIKLIPVYLFFVIIFYLLYDGPHQLLAYYALDILGAVVDLVSEYFAIGFILLYSILIFKETIIRFAKYMLSYEQRASTNELQKQKYSPFHTYYIVPPVSEIEELVL